MVVSTTNTVLVVVGSSTPWRSRISAESVGSSTPWRSHKNSTATTTEEDNLHYNNYNVGLNAGVGLARGGREPRIFQVQCCSTTADFVKVHPKATSPRGSWRI